MFSETRYARNGNLRVAYRTSHEGPRDIVFVPHWFTCCEHLPELPSLQGWVEAMTSLGQVIFFDQPGTGAPDPVTPDALPTLEQWADSITAGDGFLAMFDGPQRAIRCAMSIRDAVRSLGIEVRAGLHTGECEIRGDDIGGIGVHIGARVSGLAGPNEVLVSSTLRDLVIGSGLEFEERGSYELKGVPGEWRLFAVASARTT
jgi:hypothetical protein